MRYGFFSKLQIFLNSRKIFKNWYIYPQVYFKLTKKEYVIFETRSGLKIKIRVDSTDLMALTHVWMIKEYYEDNFQINENKYPTFRSAFFFKDSRNSKSDILKKMLCFAISESEKFFPAFQLVLWAGKKAEEAIMFLDFATEGKA